MAIQMLISHGMSKLLFQLLLHIRLRLVRDTGIMEGGFESTDLMGISFVKAFLGVGFGLIRDPRVVDVSLEASGGAIDSVGYEQSLRHMGTNPKRRMMRTRHCESLEIYRALRRGNLEVSVEGRML